MRFAAVQYDIAWEDKESNHAAIEQMLDEASVAPGTFILLPELGDTGFSFNLDVIADDRTLLWATGVARRRGVWIQAGFAERAPDGFGRNCAAIINPRGDIEGVYRKVHPFSYGREIEHFRGGDRLFLARCGEFQVCPLICYDLRFPELWRLGALAGAEVYTIGACWPEARQAHWRSLVVARAIENQAYVVAVNRVGRDPHLGYAGGSMIASPRGKILADAAAAPCVLTADLDPGPLRDWRAKFPALRDAHQGLLGDIAIDRAGDSAPASARTEGSAPSAS
jgi:predicted amidohydrolase